MTRNGRTAGIAILALLVGGVTLYGFWRTGQAEASRPKRTAAIPVETARVTVGSLTSKVSAVGKTAGRRDVVVSTEAAGRIVKVCVDPGVRVTQGTVIAEVDNELRRLAVEQAVAQLGLAKANAEQADRDAARNEALFASGDLSSSEMEGFRVAAQAASSALRVAEAGLGAARRQLVDTQVRSPIPGIVASRLVEVGETVAPGAPVANVVDLEVVKVLLSVPEEEIGRVGEGQASMVTSDLHPGLVLEGTVLSVGAKAEGDSHRYPVEVEVANPDGRLRAGMFVRTTIVTAVQDRIPLTPVGALVDEGGVPKVYVVKDGRARLRPVTLAGREAGLAGFSAGLMEGDLVVTVGQQLLQDGALVEVK